MWPPLRHSLAAAGALAGLPLGAAAWLARPDARDGLAQRLGRAPEIVPGCVWVHGASVGEILAAMRLMDALRARGVPVLGSTMTRSGQQVLRRARPDLPATLAPLDHPWSVARALRRARPRALLLIETELWPSWIAAARRRAIPVLVASGRLSDRGYARQRRFQMLLRPTFARLTAVAARSEEDAERFRTLGAAPERVRVTGDLKLEPPASLPPLAEDLARVLEDARPCIAASTHAGEEEAVLEAWARVRREAPPVPLVLAPRHPERAPQVADQVRRRGHPLRLRSALGPEPLGADQVLLLDTLGELPSLLPRASVVFVGGTLTPVGGHNLVEPAFAARPLLFGPHTENWREASAQLLQAGGARRVSDAQALARALVDWLCDPEAAERAGKAARSEVERHRGATERTLAWLEPWLIPGSSG